MDEATHVLLCFGCKRRIVPEELHSGQHDHVDAQERLAYEAAANDGID